ncbi:serine hydrolase [Arthrobacter psychrolactophilus]|uniref:Serine hydrolase n=1 Tax=Arthrobacter psychrolactophilus TaxID=92442 RepID=A0A2V5JH33_9MICC|nr:serine hydrolase [Arthrobacter psychrolactophilus]
MSIQSPYADGASSISFVALDWNGSVIASHNPDEPYYAASTIKLAVLLAAMRLVDTHKLDLTQLVTVRNTFPSRIPGAGNFTFDLVEQDNGMSEAGTDITLAQALGRMIYVSSNAATNMVIDLVGLDAVTEELQHCGTQYAKMERLISDHVARDQGFTHEASAHDLAIIMQHALAGTDYSASSTAFIREVLGQQEFPVIATQLPAHTVWGSKSGWVDGIHHDVAYIGEPGTESHLILAVCTRGFSHEQGANAISAVASSVIQFRPDTSARSSTKP